MVENYIVTTYVLWGMGFFGVSGVAGTGAAAVGSALKSIPTTIEKSGASAGAIIRGGASAAGGAMSKSLTGGYAARGFIIAWIVGQTAATILAVEQTEMRKEIIRRYQESRLSAALYQKALGSDMPAPQRDYFQIS